ncbi:MAG: hypothetical protein IJ545_04720 [Alphaproteobacteria bacterium]|nr:hypothetical protein [Alphaproteobacteria bacterium]
MSEYNDTLQQVANSYSKVQQTLVNQFIKDLNFMKTVPWTVATHGIFNRYEEVAGVKGAAFREWDAPNVEMDISTIVKEEPLGVLGGEMSVSAERALLIANDTKDSGKAAEKYFEKRTPIVLNDAGKQTEKHFIYNILYKKMAEYNKLIASDASKRTMFDAGGAGSTNWSIFALRQNKELNCGLLSPIGENNDELMTMEWLNDGALHKITSGANSGKLGYEAVWKSYFGYQLAVPQHLGGIFNIDPDNSHNVTPAMIDDMLDAMEADPADTVLVMARGMQTRLGRLKLNFLRVDNEDTTISSDIKDWHGIKIIGTNTHLRGTEEKVIMPWA